MCVTVQNKMYNFTSLPSIKKIGPILILPLRIIRSEPSDLCYIPQSWETQAYKYFHIKKIQKKATNMTHEK